MRLKHYAPIAFILVFLGAVVGYVIQSRAWLGEQVPNLTMALLIMLPSIMAAEWLSEPEPAVRDVWQPDRAQVRHRQQGAVAGLFLPRPRYDGREARIQPHGRAARHLGEGAGSVVR